MIWTKLVDALVSPAVFAAVFVLASVIVTARTTIRVARDRLAHERDLARDATLEEAIEAARERLFEKRVELALDASNVLQQQIEAGRVYAMSRVDQSPTQANPPGTSVEKSDQEMVTRLLILGGVQVARTFVDARTQAWAVTKAGNDGADLKTVAEAVKLARHRQTEFHKQLRVLIGAPGISDGSDL